MAPMNIPEDVLSRDLDGEAVLLDLRSGRYFGLNGTGAFVWQQLKDGLEREEIAHALTDEYEVDIKTARADVSVFIDTLIERGLIRRVNAQV